MKLSEVTKKEFLHAMKDPDMVHRQNIVRIVRAALAKGGFKIGTVRAKYKTGEIYFTIPGIVDATPYNSAKAMIENSLPKGAMLMNSWYLGNDYYTPLGHASFFIEPYVQSDE